MNKNIVMISPHNEGFYKEGIPGISGNIGKNKAVNIGAKPDIDTAILEHQKLVDIIINSGDINVINLDFPTEELEVLNGNDNKLSETNLGKRKYFKDNIIFSRDGFISNRKDKVILSKFSNPSRKFEPKVISELITGILDDTDLVRDIISVPNIEGLFLEGGDFRFIENDKILFAGFNSDGKTSRNSKSGIQFVKGEFDVKDEDFLIIESKGYHLDTVFSVLTNDKGNLVGGMICPGLIDNLYELKEFFNNKGLKLLYISNEYGVRDSDLNPNGNGIINTLNINDILISSGSFSDEIESELNELGIKRFIAETSQFWEAGGGPHCLTNEL